MSNVAMTVGDEDDISACLSVTPKEHWGLLQIGNMLLQSFDYFACGPFTFQPFLYTEFPQMPLFPSLWLGNLSILYIKYTV